MKNKAKKPRKPHDAFTVVCTGEASAYYCLGGAERAINNARDEFETPNNAVWWIDDAISSLQSARAKLTRIAKQQNKE